MRAEHHNLRIHNLGIGGYSQSMQVHQIELAAALGARIVLLAVCPSNDVLENDGIVIRGIGADNFRSDGGLKHPIQGLKNSPPTWLEKHFRLYPVLKVRLGITRPQTAMGSTPWYTLDQLRKQPGERTLQAFARTTELLDEMLRKCAERGIKLIVTTCPKQYEMSEDFFQECLLRYGLGREEVDRAGVSRFYETWCQTNDVPFFDMISTLEKCGVSPRKLFFQIDGHPTARGHEVMAAALADFLDGIMARVEEAGTAKS